MERVSLNPLVKALQKEGIEAFGPVVGTVDCKPESLEAFRVWRKYKPEVYSLAALLADPVIKSAFNNRDIESACYGLEKLPIEVQCNFAAKNAAIQMQSEVDDKMIDVLIGGSTPNMRAYYMRLTYLLMFLGPLFPAKRSLESVESFIKSGINTGCDVMGNVHGVVGQILAESDQIMNAAAVAQNSYYFPSNLSTEHVEIMDPVLRVLRKNANNFPPNEPITFTPFERKLFQIEGNGEEGRLVLSDQGQLEVEMEKFKALELLSKFSEYVSPQTDCLGRAKINGISSFRVTWNWIHEISSDLYRLNR